jgi:hypothetical protein
MLDTNERPIRKPKAGFFQVPWIVRHSHLIVLVGLWIGLVACLASWTAHFVRAEHTLYYWDYLIYWEKSAELSDAFRHGLLRTILVMHRSMPADYNDLAALPAACVMTIKGTSRLVYIQSNVLLLVLPALSSVMLCLVRFSYDRWSQVVWFGMALISLMLVPITWVNTLDGYVDAGGILLAVIATSLMIGTDLETKTPLSRWLILGFVMAFLALYRRWYLFLIVGLLLVFLTNIVIHFILEARRSRSINLELLRTTVLYPALCLITFLWVFCAASWPLPWRILHTDYASQFSAYQLGDSWGAAMLANISRIIDYYGAGQLVLACLCLFPALWFQGTRRTTIYLSLPAVIAVAYFSHTQSMGTHHSLLVFLALTVIPLILSKRLILSNKPMARLAGWGIVSLSLLLSCLNFQSVFSPYPSPFSIGSTFSDLKMLPQVRRDLPQFEALMQFINRKAVDSSAAASGKPFVYLVSSSYLLNASATRTLDFQLGIPLPGPEDVYYTRDVDLRDGFPDELVNADMVLVPTPPQIHLTKGQKIITVPTQLFLDDQGFARAFTKDPQSFLFDNGIRLYVFERTRPSSPEEIAQLHKEIGL